MSNGVKVAGRKAVRRASVCAVAAICGALMGQTLFAQTTSGTGSGTDALGIFQGLSADQQQQIMQRLGGSGTVPRRPTSSCEPNSADTQPNDQQQNPAPHPPRRRSRAGRRIKAGQEANGRPAGIQRAGFGGRGSGHASAEAAPG